MELTQEQRQALLKYEEYKLQIKEIESAMEPLKEIILPIMVKDVKLEGEKGMFELKERAVWKFTSDIKEAEKELKNKKDMEIATGLATKTATQYLEYRENKVEKEDEGI